ncbi:5870_t:CDS:2, partial [Rhizophagus irregularis]
MSSPVTFSEDDHSFKDELYGLNIKDFSGPILLKFIIALGHQESKTIEKDNDRASYLVQKAEVLLIAC